MENEGEEASQLAIPPPVQLEVDSMDITTTTTTTATTGTVMDSHEEVQRNTEPQCEPDSVTELSESQLPPQEQSLGEGKERDEDSVVADREDVAEVDESKLAGRGDELRDSQLVVSTVVGEEDGEEKRAVANSEDVVSGGVLVVPVPVVGGEAEDGDMIDKQERGMGDGAEETKEMAHVGDVVVEAEVAEETKPVDVAGDTDERVGMTEETEITDEEKGDDVVERTEIEDETTGIVDDLVGEMEERDEMAEHKETFDERKAVDILEEVEIVDDEVDEMHERVEMVEDREIAGEKQVVDVAEDKEIYVGDLAKETVTVENGKVADTTESTAADEMEVGDVAEGTGMQEDERELADVEGRETELMEEIGKSEEETEVQEMTETDPEMETEMADGGEETMEAGADLVEETEKAEEIETGEEVEDVSTSVGGKRKRVGRNSKSTGKAPSRKKSEEDVCFICFDGGDLVLCDRRGCPKAYHPSCVNRDEAFFQSKGRWNCGWHLCSICEKNAYYMCYTCTFSLCKGCIKDAVILCVRGNKGFCETCMKTVMLIERNEQGNKEVDQVDFDDKNSWEYLFKDYWLDLKGRLSLSSDELARAKNPWKRSDMRAGKQDTPDEPYDANIDGEQGSESSSGNAEATVSKRRKAKKRSKSSAKERDSPGTVRMISGEGMSTDESVEWASKELLDLVMHMRNGDKSVLSQFEVQTLLLEYIKKYKLRDPHRRTHVICDSRLQTLFGKPRVGHFEMLKLLESHFLTKEDSQVDELQGSVVDTEGNQLEDGNSDALIKGVKDKKRKTRKKGDDRRLQSNLDDYAAIDMHNINLIYLRRNLVEELLADSETFCDKVVGTFVRIRISGSVQKQDLYRLVQVVGTSKVGEPYKVGKRMTDILLEILNLNKTEFISIDIISNQEFTEDECKRLRQSIKCGLINRLTVGDIHDKAMALQAVRVKDWMEAEILRLSHLRDRASDLGRRKELRECVEKLQLLKTPEERQRRLEEIPEIHSDSKMDPSYESEEEDDETDDKRQENYMRTRGSSFSRRGREPISPRKGSSFSNDSFSATRSYSGVNKELSRSMSNKSFSNRGDDFVGAGEMVNENLWSQARDKETQHLNSWEKPRTASNIETGARNPHSVVLSESISRVVSENSPASASTGVTQSTATVNESEKMWHYQDPSGKVQGPFSLVQLRKWNNTGYFPANLRVWRSTEKQDDSILLTDALAGRFHKDPPLADIHMSQTASYSGKPHGAPLQSGMETPIGGNSNFDQNRTAWNLHGTLSASGQSVGGNWKLQTEISSTGGAVHSVDLPKQLSDGWGSETSLPSPTPTPTQSTAAPAGDTREKMFEKEWSPTPTNQSGSLMTANHFSGGNGGKQSPTVIFPESGQLKQFSSPSSTSKLSGNIDALHVAHGVTSASKTETGESHRVLASPHQLPGSDSVVVSMNPSVDLKNIGATLQSLVQPLNTHIIPVESHGWGSGSAARPEMISPSPKPGGGSQGWGSASSQNIEPNNQVSIPTQSPAYVQPYASSFSTGNSSGVFPASGQSGMPPSDPWRPPVPGQSNVQPPAQPIPTWGMGVTGHQNAVPRQGSENQNTGWGPTPGNPSIGWGGQIPANTNMNWGAPGNANSGWAAPGQGQAPKNAIPGWVPPGQGPSPVNAIPGWVAPGQGPLPGNANAGLGAPTGNQGMWGSEQNNGGDRFSSQRERNSHSGDSGYGGGRPWNRQSSFGSRGDSSRPPFNKGQRVCKFHESGHCKKGSQCDYLHT